MPSVERDRPERVCVAIATYNRCAMLIDLLEALARQTRPVDQIVLIDNGCTDGTVQTLAAGNLPERLPLWLSVLGRNAGAAGGYGVAVQAAAETGADRVWVFDDDEVPADDCLERLLASPPADDPSCVVVTPAKYQPDGRRLLLSRGTFDGFQRPLPEEEYREGAYPELDYSSYGGPLVRADAVRALGAPDPRLYMWVDDVEWFLRLKSAGTIRLVPEARVTHMDDVYAPVRPGWRGAIQELARPVPHELFWKHLYGFRNLTYIRRRRAGKGLLGFAAYLAIVWGRTLAFNPDKRLRLRLYWEFGLDGYRGRFMNFTPADWHRLSRSPHARRKLRAVARPAAPPEVRLPLGPFRAVARSLSRP